jgi:hypothetical protein
VLDAFDIAGSEYSCFYLKKIRAAFASGAVHNFSDAKNQQPVAAPAATPAQA